MTVVDFQIVANLMAGKGTVKKTLVLLTNFLEKNQQTFSVLAIEKPTPISLLPQQNQQIRKAVVCLGGDGTVSESMAFILNKKIDLPLAIIPSGTANIIASSLGITGQSQNFDFLLKNNLKETNIGLAEYGSEKNYFLLGLGLGFEENFLRLTKEKAKTHLGVFSYIFAALSELLSLKKIPLQITFPDKQMKVEVCTLMILNLQPKILKLFPLFKKNSRSFNDGLLDLTFVEYKNYLQAFFSTLILHVLGELNLGSIKSFSAKEFYIDSPQIIKTQLDGELKANLPVKISLLPKTFNFLV